MTHKQAKNFDEAWNMQHKYTGKPHGWIQWKGTDVCMDIHCACGALTHIDDSHCYSVGCPECGKVYFVNGNVELIEITEPSKSDIVKIPQIVGV